MLRAGIGIAGNNNKSGSHLASQVVWENLILISVN